MNTLHPVIPPEDEAPLVSVVIPSFNAELTLAECLDSILGQQYTNLEIIVIDDQSVDGTMRIAQEYANKDGRIRVIQKKRNAGPSAARNDGLRMAHGKYLQFVDADDILDTSAIATTVDIAEHTGADLVSFNFKVIRDGRVAPRSGAVPLPYPKLEQSSGIECLRQIYLGHLGYFSWAFLYRFETVRTAGVHYPKNVHLLEDMLMLNQLLQHDLTVAYCVKPLYTYRNNGRSLSHAKDSERALQGLNVVTTVEHMCGVDDLQLYARSSVPILLYLDSLLPVKSSKHKLLRSEARRMASVGGVTKLNRHVLLRLFLTTTGIIDLVRKLKH